MRNDYIENKYILVGQQQSYINMEKPYRTRSTRFLVLVMLSLLIFGNQYSFNNPQALEQSIQKDLNISQTEFQLFYTIFSFPNIFSTFILGMVIDYIGVRISLITLSALVTSFQFMVAMGGYFYSYRTMLVGRMLFGLASQSLITAQASMVAFWFKGRELGLALGIAVTFPELGNALNSFVTPQVYQMTGSLGSSLMVSVGVCLISFCCGAVATYIDWKADQVDRVNRVLESETQTQSQHKQHSKLSLSALKQFPGSYWLLISLCMFASTLYVPFMDNANRLYIHRFCFSQVSSGRALMVTYIVAAFVSAPLGLWIDSVGKRRRFIVAAMCVFVTGQLIIYGYPQCQHNQLDGAILGLGFIGLGYCFYGNCILSSIPLIVHKHMTATAFGIMQMIESTALAFVPLVTGAIVDHSGSIAEGYQNSSLFFVLVGFCGLAISFGLFLIPQKYALKFDRKPHELPKQQPNFDSHDGQLQQQSPDSQLPALHGSTQLLPSSGQAQQEVKQQLTQMISLNQ